MLLSLAPHPDFPRGAVDSIEVEVSRLRPGLLTLDYRLSGTISALSLPAPAPPLRADELWQHTCFEAFVRAGPGGSYYEFNFAPSLQWAAYRLGSYRSEMREAELSPPEIRTESNVGSYAMHVALQLSGLSDLPLDSPWQLNLAAVVEEASGRKSYWALAHPAGKADFHHPDCFTHQLTAA